MNIRGEGLGFTGRFFSEMIEVGRYTYRWFTRPVVVWGLGIEGFFFEHFT